MFQCTSPPNPNPHQVRLLRQLDAPAHMSNGSTVQFDGFWEQRDSCARVRAMLLGARLVRKG